MSHGKPGVIRTEIPIIGNARSFQEALTELMQKMIIPTFNQVGVELANLNSRIEELEQCSKHINIYINPAEAQKLFQPAQEAKSIEDEIIRLEKEDAECAAAIGASEVEIKEKENIDGKTIESVESN